MSHDTAIDSIKREIDIIQIIGEVTPLKKKGANHFGCCPFHKEKTPSFSVNGERQLFHCFGCKLGGDVFKFVQLYYKWDFPQALEELAKRANITLEKFKKDPDREEALKILETVGTFFQEQLSSKAGESHREYLKHRKITQESAESFRLGVHPGGSQSLVKLLKEKSLNRDIAVQLGILGRSKAGDYIDRFQERLMFPIMDEKGVIRAFGGRSLENEHPKYINSPTSFIFDKGRILYGMHLASDQIRKMDYLVLVEGYFDVIALHEYGVSNAVGSMGTALTTEQLKLIRRWSSRAISLYDTDQAGLTATEKNLGGFFKEGIEAKVIQIPGEKDPDSYLHSDRPEAQKKQELRDLFKQAIPALDFLIKNSIMVESDALKRGHRLRELVQLLDQVPGEIERAILKKDIAKRFELSEEILNIPKSMPASRQRPSSKVPRKASFALDKELFAFVIRYGEDYDLDLKEVLPWLWPSSPWFERFIRLVSEGQSSKDMARLDWLSLLEEGDQVLVREWTLEERPAIDKDEVRLVWTDIVNRCRESFVKRESERIHNEIKIAETASDFDRIKALLSEKQDMIRYMRQQNTGTSLGE